MLSTQNNDKHQHLTLFVIPSQNLSGSNIQYEILELPKLQVGLSLNVIKDIPKRTRIGKYTLAIFLQRGREIHGDKYNYSHVKSDHIKGRDSKILVICNTCYYEWYPSISSHITHKSGCPMCSGNARWTLERFLIETRKVNGDKYDYSHVTEEHIKNHGSHIPVLCLKCKHMWEPDIHSHVRGQGCPGCLKRIPWTLERVIIRFCEVHLDKYDYSQITEKHIINCNSKVPIRCKTCNRNWNPTIDSHVKGSGCPKCNKSKGEKICLNILETMGLNVESQVRIKALPRRPYDFGFNCNEEQWLLEFDGQQHFHFNEFFHKDMTEFLDRQVADVTKTKQAISEGYHVIHIDYTQIDNVEYHIRLALNLGQLLYLSTPILYSHYN